MESNPNIDLLVSNYDIFFCGDDKGSKSYIENQKKMNNTGEIKKIRIDPKWAYISRPGCTYCFRKKFYQSIENQWNESIAHDAILWRFAKINDSFALLDLPLIHFRRHGDNVTSINKKNRTDQIQTFKDYIYFYELALEKVDDSDIRSVLSKGIEFLNSRISFYKKPQIFLWLKLALFYHQYYYTYKGWLGDMFFAFRNTFKKR